MSSKQSNRMPQVQALLLGMIAGQQEETRERQIIETCMEAKGYTLTQSNLPQTEVASGRK